MEGQWLLLNQLGKYHDSSLSSESESAHRGTLDRVIVVAVLHQAGWTQQGSLLSSGSSVAHADFKLTYIKPRGKNNYGSTKLQGIQLLSHAKHTL